MPGRKPRHGESTPKQTRTAEYVAWFNMKQRCSKPRRHNAASYLAKGIRVCERWQNSYEAFLEDVGRRPGPTYSIDRIDNDGNYEPGNCRWATKTEQARNTRQVVWYRLNGRKVCQAELCSELGVRSRLFSQRMKRDGWPPIFAAMVP